MNAVATPAKLDITQMGIQDFERAINNGEMVASEVAKILDARLAKREASGKPLLAPIVAYYEATINKLDLAGVKHSFKHRTAPTHKAKPSATGAKVTHGLAPIDLAKRIFEEEGANYSASVITCLMDRISAKK